MSLNTLVQLIISNERRAKKDDKDNESEEVQLNHPRVLLLEVRVVIEDLSVDFYFRKVSVELMEHILTAVFNDDVPDLGPMGSVKSQLVSSAPVAIQRNSEFAKVSVGFSSTITIELIRELIPLVVLNVANLNVGLWKVLVALVVLDRVFVVRIRQSRVNINGSDLAVYDNSATERNPCVGVWHLNSFADNSCIGHGRHIGKEEEHHGNDERQPHFNNSNLNLKYRSSIITSA